MIEHNGELRLALARIADMRKQMEEAEDVEGLHGLAWRVDASAGACWYTHDKVRQAKIQQTWRERYDERAAQ